MSGRTSRAVVSPALSREYLLHHRLCPREFPREGFVLVIAAPDALLDDALDDLRLVYGREVEIEEASFDEVQRLIERQTVGALRELEVRHGTADEDMEADVRDLANQPPVIRYVSLLLSDAFESGASDIHLEATREGLKARFRLDGVLAPALECPKEYHHAVVSRVKLLAELDIAERRRPQDGRIRVRLDSRETDVRVATVPTLHGESVVLRLLDHSDRPVSLGDLGMRDDVLSIVSTATQRAHGLFLVTGPTGSGKTTTLYSALQERDATREKIITVEDPIEYQLRSVTQVPVHRQAGVTFGSALRSILRQDPDVIMIGEMRDPETAEIAIQAAMTGHMVFSTLHTNDAVGAIPRLLDLGVPEYLLAATLDGVLAQRLVRRVCQECQAPCEPDGDLIGRVAGREAEPGLYVHGFGCPGCRGTGYRGRIGVFEMLSVDDAMRDAITRRAPKSELHSLAGRAGMRTMEEDAWTKARCSITTIEEVRRVLQG
jgi:type II secretory ATPase GspE/PulE/Tfp pilus assembly ATPase PilB-like protein